MKLTLLPLLWSFVGVPLLLLKNFYFYSSDLIFANYNGYMSPKLLSLASNQYNMQFTSIDNDKEIDYNFSNNNFDAAIVSHSTLTNLIKKNLVKKIDWQKLINIDSTEKIKPLFTSYVTKVFDKYKEHIDYSIPYFISYLSFFYRGSEIESFKSEKNWTQILEIISKEDRFKNKKIGIIDDPQTIFTFSKLLNSKENNNADIPIKDKSYFQKSFNQIPKIKNLFFTPDSTILLDMLSKKEFSGAFIYSGDALFSLQGGNDNIDISENDFHAVNANRLSYFLDSIVISSKISESKEKRIYEFIKKIIFEGNDQANMFEEDNDGEYKYWPAINFDYVCYTPTLKKTYDDLSDDPDIYNPENTYEDLKKEMLLIGLPESKFEPEESLDESNFKDLLIEYNNWKTSIF